MLIIPAWLKTIKIILIKRKIILIMIQGSLHSEKKKKEKKN